MLFCIAGHRHHHSDLRWLSPVPEHFSTGLVPASAFAFLFNLVPAGQDAGQSGMNKTFLRWKGILYGSVRTVYISHLDPRLYCWRRNVYILHVFTAGGGKGYIISKCRNTGKSWSFFTGSQLSQSGIGIPTHQGQSGYCWSRISPALASYAFLQIIPKGNWRRETSQRKNVRCGLSPFF